MFSRFILVLNLLVITILLAPSGLAAASADGEGASQEVNGYRVELKFDEHAKTGPNAIQIRISNQSGDPAVGYQVELVALVSAGAETAGDHAEDAMEEGSDQIHAADESEQAEMEMGAEGHESESSEHEEPEADSSYVEAGETTADDEQAPHGHAGEVSVDLEEQEPGIYTGKVAFAEAGVWQLAVHFTGPENTTEIVQFPVDVLAVEPNRSILFGFLGINLAILATAAFSKSRMAVQSRVRAAGR